MSREPTSRVFVSHAGKDRPWAEWAAWHLRAAGYPTELDCIDWSAGTNFIEAMHQALKRENPMLVLLSRAYLDPSRYTTDEWTTRLAQRRRNPAARLIPIRIDDVSLSDGIWAPMVVPDVFSLSAGDAVVVLITAVRATESLPASTPPYPGHVGNIGDATTPDSGPRPPGSLPPVWNVARRNPAFTGRDNMINHLHDTLGERQHVAIQALHGMGGVGKSQLAVEYAHRYAGEYELVWGIDSEHRGLIGDQLAALATATGITPAGTDISVAVDQIRALLRRRSRWLIIFDNVESRDDLVPWLPDGDGHLIITSRSPLWSGVAQPISVDVFARLESISLLQTNLPHLSKEDGNRLAEALGDLPLAIAQAADLLAETGMPVDAYLTALDEHAADLFASDQPPAFYHASLAAAVTVAVQRLTAQDLAAGQLLTLCAYLAPEPIPLDLFRNTAGVLSSELAAAAESGVALDRAAGRLSRYGLARPVSNGLQLHRLTQAILRDTDPEPGQHRNTVERLLIAARPDDGDDPALWPRWRLLMPHILACDPATSDNIELRSLAHGAVWHLLARGDARTALPLAEHMHSAWNDRHGPDDAVTLNAAKALAYSHYQLAHYQQALSILNDILARHRRILGEDHPDTLGSANNLADCLRESGDFSQARKLDEETLARRRGILGDDHPHTLTSAGNLAGDLHALGKPEQARQLDEDTLARRRRILGEDHPHTLTSANNLAEDLVDLGEYGPARRLLEDTVDRRRRILGHDHPKTLNTARNLAAVLRRLGELELACQIDEDTLLRLRRVLGDDHPDTLASASSLANDRRQLGDLESARQLDEDVASGRLRLP
jgi:tetratricopeptide (TPR) repeat protein